MQIANNILIPEIGRLIASGKDVILLAKGNSMLPFIRDGRDSILLSKCDEVSVGDVVLAAVAPSFFVLHRVIAVDGENLTLMGDGNLKGTERCTKSDVLGKAKAIIRPSGKSVAVPSGRLWRKIPCHRYILALYRRILRFI